MPLDPVLTAQGEVVGSINVGQMWDRLRNEYLEEWAQINRQGLSDEAVESHMQAFMDGLSEKPLEDLARKSSSVAYNQGRSVGIKESGVELVVRSEVLDSSTCDPCARLDTEVVEVNSPDYERLMPPAFCLGGRRCRGFYIPVTEEFLAGG